MARNGSGTMTPSVDFTTEAASPPIEISKLDTVLDDIAAEITNSLAADGQTAPTADIPLNGHKLTGVGAPTALTDAVTATTVIDQELQYYVDSGSANTYVITPSPAIAAYEEGQRFVVRIANASSGASTLNVNGLGAIAIQTADATAVASGTLAAGGIYEFTYDANTSPDRWVVTSPTSKIPDGMLSSNVPLINAANVFTGAPQAIAAAGAALRLDQTNAGADTRNTLLRSAGPGFRISSAADATPTTAASDLFNAARSGTTWSSLTLTATAFTFNGTTSTPNTSAAEVGFKGTPQNAQNGDYTLVLTDAGKTIYKASGGAGETITIPANGTVAFPVGTIVRIVNNGGGDLTIAITTDTLSLVPDGTTGSRTLSDHGVAVLEKVAATEWFVSGAGVS